MVRANGDDPNTTQDSLEVYEKTLNRLLKKYVTAEEYDKLMSGDEQLIKETSPLAQAKYAAYLKLKESLYLSGNREFNRLVEQKAKNYRAEKTRTWKEDRRKLLEEEERYFEFH